MQQANQVIDLAGEWQLRLDRQDIGIVEQWFAQPFATISADKSTATAQLPGSLQAQGHGDDVTLDSPWIGNIVDRSLFDSPRYAPYREPGNIKYPCWLNPEKVYVGAAWFQREIALPDGWAGQRMVLTLERAHWETRVWIDGREVGTQRSLSTPHAYELGVQLKAGKHLITLRVDNRMLINVGANAHSMTDHTQTNWNGVIGRMELAAATSVWLRNVQVHPDIAQQMARVQIDIASRLQVPLHGSVTITAQAYNTATPHECEPLRKEFSIAALGDLATWDRSTEGGHLDLAFPLGAGAQQWDEFTPTLYALTVTLTVDVDGKTVRDQREVTFGLREVGVVDTQIAVNGRKTFLRGTLECCIFPLTGYPPTEVEPWKRIIRICKAHGLNHIRFHSWCPPEAAFVAADELGFYFQIECPTWPNQGAAIGEGRPLDRWLYEEGERIMAAYGNHPSFLLFCHGNEPTGRHAEYLRTWVSYWRTRDGRRLYTSGAGWPAIGENQYHNIPEPRIHHWGEGNGSRINALPPETRTTYSAYVERKHETADEQFNHGLTDLPSVPLISHEIGQWCVYPNFAEMDKYTGLLKAKNFEIFSDFLAANGMADQAHDFFMASGKLQALCYKEEIESALRTPGFGGFHLLDLHDFPGQGTALVGVLDPFWEGKGYITATEFHRFCGPTVPLAMMDKRYWHTDETFVADIRIAHFGPRSLKDAVIDWRLCNDAGESVRHGTIEVQHIAVGNDGLQGNITIALAGLPTAQRYKLVVGLSAAQLGTCVENDWDIWLFAPAQVALPASTETDILLSTELDAAALQTLRTGGTVLLMAPPEQVRSESQVGFSTVFWNTAWTSGQAPHTLGILCDPAHPLFAEFPTEYHSNWQWWELVHGAAAMMLDALPRELRPLVQPIDTWFEARRLGLLFEARVAGGKLMVCSMDLQSDLTTRLVARQLRHSLLGYMGSASFAPTVDVTEEQIQRLFVH